MPERVWSRLPVWPRLLLVLGAGVFASSCGGRSRDRTQLGPSSSALGCPSLSLDCAGAAPSYSAEVAPIIQEHCAGSGCHARSDAPDAPWAFEDEDDVAEWSFSIQSDIADCLMPPPDHEPGLSEADRETLNAWLVCGAPNN